MKKAIALLAAAAIVSTLAGVANAGKPVSVFEDPAGDADNAQGLGQSIPGGFDLVSGTIHRDKTNLVFTVTHADMPETGSLPEGFRFLWHFQVDGTEYRMTVKSVDIGKPDAVAQSGTDRVGRVDTAGHFRLEECFIEVTPAIQLSQCVPVEYLEGAFTPAEKSFSFILPMATVKAKTGSIVQAGTGGASGTGCQICWLPHYGERSLTPHTIIDAATQVTAFKVPKK